MCERVESDLLGHTIICSRPSMHFDDTQLHGRHHPFNTSCTVYAIKSLRCPLSVNNARPYTVRLSQLCLQGYDELPWPVRSPGLSPIEHVWQFLGIQLQSSQFIGE
ncbi:uncharacterized protein TNCV_2931531 [Trichonephila clavipes]|nr:uncharacterized protein TNCV_2931531 [Trichonephila clavipes]